MKQNEIDFWEKCVTSMLSNIKDSNLSYPISYTTNITTIADSLTEEYITLNKKLKKEPIKKIKKMVEIQN